jgi:hypothetical protein
MDEIRAQIDPLTVSAYQFNVIRLILRASGVWQEVEYCDGGSKSCVALKDAGFRDAAQY